MMSDQVLVIKTNVPLPTKIRNQFRQEILNQIETSDVVLLPSFCDVIIVPKGIQIKFESNDTNIKIKEDL